VLSTANAIEFNHFSIQGEVYNGCPVDLEDTSKRWCSTRVDANGEHITGAGEFGHCGPDCPIYGTIDRSGIPTKMHYSIFCVFFRNCVPSKIR